MAAPKSRRTLAPGSRIRVLIVDDSVAVRHLVTLALENDPSLEVVGTAANGKQALDRVIKLVPDVVTMDIEMPEMDGLEALRNIRNLAPQVRVIMLSTLTERGASVTLEALSIGADDYITKLSDGRSVEESKVRLRSDLIPKIKQFFALSEPSAPEGATVSSAPRQSVAPAADPPQISRRPAPMAMAPQPSALIGHRPCVPRVVAIGVSTGGPTALAAILHEFPRDFSLPILIVQHMPPLFTKLLAERLQERAKLPIREAVHHEPLKPGVILIAPGDFHMRVEITPGERQPRIVLDQSPPQNSCRPSVDVLFESIENVFHGAVVSAVLTGMGQDGLRGAKLLKAAGGTVLAQDEETSAVWGMPRAIADAHIADAILPLDAIVPQILRQCSSRSLAYDQMPREIHQ